MVEIDLTQIWKKVLETIFSSLDPQTQELWVSPITPKELKDNILILNAPNKYFEDWIISGGYKTKIEEIVSKELKSNIEIKFDYQYDLKSIQQDNDSGKETDFEYSAEKVFVLKESFNPNYTFEEFITDESNRFAKAVCETAAKEPGVAYNPIFIYAPVGLGKTHLLHAIGNKMLEMSKKFRIAYISASKFVSDFVTAIQTNRLDIFRSKFQNSIALLLDDVQFLIEKEKSQEEFFQLFNMLFDMKKQIVITSDRKPQDLKGIEERLISRFEWGVVADIGKPSMELRLAILQHKAQKQKVYVPDDVLPAIA
ncbi:MAG: DnaA/Hda family protein, partial [Endomicrobiia bacterium]